ncbi:Bax inhibitor-1/YccA family protein [Thalassospira sp.]|uniref:Bax inhibitor-1/YccA family protein n=1 Tax=Thalassospira sp. TaxID=1912094 RepID=UPI002735BC68|nr:Bax inhibitor-1/YccA family protein [Thalassospira sp.]MDP2699016.1 Bax inhibitor-1/YccA family protein [Thalassospira sp.]
MAFETRQRGYDVSVGRSAAEVDAGLRAYMLSVYNYMASALALTGIVAMVVSTNDALMSAIFGSGLGFVVMLAPIGLVLFLSMRIHKMSFGAAQTTFWIYAALMGLSLSSIFLVYTGESIARTFFIAASTFGAMSLYGYTTKKDLSGWGSFLFMGLIGIILASVVNIFLGSGMLQFVISAAGVLIFTGLTAYDTQRIKESYFVHDDQAVAGKKAIFGALQLYLDFINLFIMLLHFFGNRE